MQKFCLLLSHFGWTKAAVDKRVQQIRCRQSCHAGVSMAYLLRDFVELAQQQSQEADPTFLQLKEAFWCNEQKMGQDVTCPRDGKLGCAFVDLLCPEHRRKQNHFMSWSWRYSLGQLRLVASQIVGCVFFPCGGLLGQ